MASFRKRVDSDLFLEPHSVSGYQWVLDRRHCYHCYLRCLYRHCYLSISGACAAAAAAAAPCLLAAAGASSSSLATGLRNMLRKDHEPKGAKKWPWTEINQKMRSQDPIEAHPIKCGCIDIR